ncbi:MAG: transcription factor [Caeruleum heppii]|nr:MAG: transcription factor [Caeruleum heppii]
MPPSTTRRTRARRETEPHEMSDAELPDSSPSRPAKKKRRTAALDSPHQVHDDGAPARHNGPSHPEENPNHVENLVDFVISNLATGPGDVRVAIDHSNTKLEREYRNGVQAYAKVSGVNWTYYVKTLKVNIGRPPDPVHPAAEAPVRSSPAVDQEDSMVQIDLGPSKLVSRQHATIEYSSEGDSNWKLSVNGRNGVRVNDQSVRRGSSLGLRSGDVMEIGGTQMMFVTPDEDPHIHPIFHPKAPGQAAPERNGIHYGSSHAHPESLPHLPRSSSSQILPASVQYGPPGPVPLAPAPPDYKRQSTPVLARVPESDTRPKQSPIYNRGLLLESTEDIDYSHDSAKDLKPPFSYATMIGQAILSSEEEKLTLNNIYTWIMDKYAFYRHSQSGWQNSIRHNLSLNKAFEKIPRRTDEPGKGMKWQIVQQHRDEFTKRSARPSTKGPNRTSSAPNSPATKDGSSLLPVTSASKDHRGVFEDGRDVAASSRVKQSPCSTTPPPLSSYPVAAKEAYTPDRGSYAALSRRAEHGIHGLDDGSPLPPSRQRNLHGSSFGLSDAAQGSPPTLSSSAYMDESQAMITPAPRRQHPRLAPPSTAQVPSTYMPTSSPAPFWKYVDLGSTPARPMPDLSPTKSLGGGPALHPQSSSPPPPLAREESPSKRAPKVERISPIRAGAVATTAAKPDVQPAINGTGPSENGVPETPDEDMDEMAAGIDLAR